MKGEGKPAKAEGVETDPAKLRPAPQGGTKRGDRPRLRTPVGDPGGDPEATDSGDRPRLRTPVGDPGGDPEATDSGDRPRLRTPVGDPGGDPETATADRDAMQIGRHVVDPRPKVLRSSGSSDRDP
ncbi:MAG TPA: hypothetical protein VFS43_05470 [Polyangiaceae bacterium]|nr:hypothetical protein [Polyangiaceae bacterium]